MFMIRMPTMTHKILKTGRTNMEKARGQAALDIITASTMCPLAPILPAKHTSIKPAI